MSGFQVEPYELLAHARRREADAARLDVIGERLRGAGHDQMALGATCAWVLDDLRASLEGVEDLVRALSSSTREVAAALREGVADHRATDEAAARRFGGGA